MQQSMRRLHCITHLSARMGRLPGQRMHPAWVRRMLCTATMTTCSRFQGLCAAPHGSNRELMHTRPQLA